MISRLPHVSHILADAGESVWLVEPARIKVVQYGINLVLEDAIRSSARGEADDKHATAANIDPDRLGLISGSFTNWPTYRTAGSPLAPSAHLCHLR